jgi:hypothetical protein
VTAFDVAQASSPPVPASVGSTPVGSTHAAARPSTPAGDHSQVVPSSASNGALTARQGGPTDQTPTSLLSTLQRASTPVGGQGATEVFAAAVPSGAAPSEIGPGATRPPGPRSGRPSPPPSLFGGPPGLEPTGPPGHPGGSLPGRLGSPHPGGGTPGPQQGPGPGEPGPGAPGQPMAPSPGATPTRPSGPPGLLRHWADLAESTAWVGLQGPAR